MGRFVKEKLTHEHIQMLVEIFGEDELHVVNQMDHATLVESLLHARSAISLLRAMVREKSSLKELG
tara:strand:- start:132 stop:329 length:198 start_codon:yes stop_codon:yes gene_type:complete